MRLKVTLTEGKPNIKKLIWYHDMTIQELEQITGIPYPKLQRILSKKTLPDFYFKDVLNIAEALGYESIDEFLTDCIEVNQYKRTRNMEKAINKVTQDQRQFSFILPTTLENLIKTAQLNHSYFSVGKEKQQDVITRAIKMADPDDLLIKNGIDHLNGPDKRIVYEVQSRE